VHALQADDEQQLREAVKDRWHQPARASLVPLLGEALAIDDPDVLGSFLSGAGPSVAFLARRNVARVERLLTSMYERAGVAVTVRTLTVHEQSSDGRRVGESVSGSSGGLQSELVAEAVASARGRAQ